MLFYVCISFSYNFFPQDLPGTPVTFGGIMHIVVTALLVPFTIAAPIVIGVGLRKISKRKLGIFSIIVGCLIFVLGGLTAASMAAQSPFFGLVERLNIGTLLLWMFVISACTRLKNCLRAPQDH